MAFRQVIERIMIIIRCSIWRKTWYDPFFCHNRSCSYDWFDISSGAWRRWGRFDVYQKTFQFSSRPEDFPNVCSQILKLIVTIYFFRRCFWWLRLSVQKCLSSRTSWMYPFSTIDGFPTINCMSDRREVSEFLSSSSTIILTPFMILSIYVSLPSLWESAMICTYLINKMFKLFLWRIVFHFHCQLFSSHSRICFSMTYMHSL